MDWSYQIVENVTAQGERAASRYTLRRSAQSRAHQFWDGMAWTASRLHARAYRTFGRARRVLEKARLAETRGRPTHAERMRAALEWVAAVNDDGYLGAASAEEVRTVALKCVERAKGALEW